nr:Rid family detoxifying hydrolase [Candidatus Blochmannia vafer]
MFQSIYTNNAPKPSGPYSQAVDTGSIIYISGQLPITQETKKIPDDVYEQTYQTLKNIQYIVESKNLTMHNIVKTTVFITNIQDLPKINKSYNNFFYIHSLKKTTQNQPNLNLPARSCVEVSKLPNNAKIEIEAIAIYSMQ